MVTFKTRLSQISKTNGKIILANDYDVTVKALEIKTIQKYQETSPFSVWK